MQKLKNSFFKDIKLKNVVSIYDEFDIDPKLSFEEQKWSFKEDIIQIVFTNDYLIDVGWYPEFDPEGFFKIRVIQGINWDKPLYEKKCKDIETLRLYLQEASEIWHNWIQSVNQALVDKQ
jgi:hypothetical protein